MNLSSLQNKVLLIVGSVIAAAFMISVYGLVRLHGSIARLAGAAASEAAERAETDYWIALALIGLAAVVVIVGVIVFVRKAVVRPIREAAQAAERIARGDLGVTIEARSNDEAGQLLRSLARMNAGLAELVTQVRASAESVVSSADQVAIGTTDLSQRTEEQASSLEETAASMEQLSSTVKQNAENARQADELARGAAKRAEQGGSEVVRVVMTMNEISESAARISDIISVIDGIAFQTNILALNAAVEAARAGEQGRGFAVVAAEVRALAQRSAQAAKEIKELIGASLEKVSNGTQLVEQAGETIQTLSVDVKHVSDLMRSIAEASAEQARGVQQVNKTVTEMDKVVQQNASAVQQSASAAEGLRRQAASLVTAVSAFRGVDVAPQVAVPARAPARGRAAAAPVASTAIQAHAPQSTVPARKAAPVTAGPDDEWEQF